MFTILAPKESLIKRIKALINRMQLLTESAEDKRVNAILIESLRDLQREYQKFI